MFNSSHFIVACFCFILLLLLPLAAASPDEWADGIKNAPESAEDSNPEIIIKPPIKVLILGNSGVGKSMLLNAIQTVATGKSFESKFNFGAVTKKTEMIEYVHTDGQKYLLYNIPGLLDVDESVAKANAAEIEKAFRDQSDVPVVTLFVLTTEAGRLQPQDFEAWNAITRYVPDINDKSSVAFIVNKMDFDQFDTDEERDVYITSIRRMIQAQCKKEFPIHFLPLLSKSDRNDPRSQPRMILRYKLMGIITATLAKAVTVSEDARIKLQSEQTNEEIEKIRAALESMRAQFAEEAKVQSEAHRREMKEMLDSHAKALERAREEHRQEMANLQRQMQRGGGGGGGGFWGGLFGALGSILTLFF